MNSRRVILSLSICVVLIAITVAVYAQVLGFDFLTWDDPSYVVDHPYVQKGLTLEGFLWALKGITQTHWHPVTTISHMLDVQVFGLNPAGHHATSLLIHILNTLLLFMVFKRMTGAVWRSAFVAVMFAVHPLHVESVVWISDRNDLISTFFGLISIYAYIEYVKFGGIDRYAITALYLILSLMAKSMLVTLPFVFLLLDYWPLNRFGFGSQEANVDHEIDRKPEKCQSVRTQEPAIILLVEKIPLLAISVIVCVVSLVISPSYSGGVGNALYKVPLRLRIANAAVSYVRYIGKMMWPRRLSALYLHPNQPGGTPWAQWQVVGAVILLIAISVLLVWIIRRRYAVVGWLWYIGMLVPVIGLTPLREFTIPANMADRYTYMPLTGLFVIVAWGLADVLSRCPTRRTLIRQTIAIFMAAVILSCMWRSWLQARHWRDSYTFYEHELKICPTNTRFQNNLGVALFEQGKFDEAEEHFYEALKIPPDITMARYYLGEVLIHKGRLDEALNHFQQVTDRGAVWRPWGTAKIAQILALHPDPETRDVDQAVQLGKRAAKLTRHKNAEILDILAVVYAAAGQFDKAITTAEKALEFALAKNNSDLVDQIRKRQELYRQGKPYLELQRLNAEMR